MIKKYAIIVAGGTGKRMGSLLPKQFLKIAGKSILQHTLEAFDTILDLEIIVVSPKMYFDDISRISKDIKSPMRLVEGGPERFFSVRNGLNSIKGTGLVAIHDAVRPLVDKDLILSCFNTAALKGSAVPVVASKDSLRILTQKGSETLDRGLVRIVQTPQTFDLEMIQKAYFKPYNELFTDCASVYQQCFGQIQLVEGSYANIKITTPEDLKIAKGLLQRKN